MFSLNLFKLSMSAIKNSVSLLLCLLLFACSSTEPVSDHYFTDNGYAQGFVNDNFIHSQFSPVNGSSTKKALFSDHHLMMSLLNRPITADQAMMLAFAQERRRYNNTYSYYAVEIKGDKNSDQANTRARHTYADLISQDINAVSISAPQ